MSGSGDGHWILVYASIHMRCSATISKFRFYFIGSILATDLADHSAILNTFKDKLNGQWIKNSRRAKWRIDELNGDVHECVHSCLLALKLTPFSRYGESDDFGLGQTRRLPGPDDGSDAARHGTDIQSVGT